MPYKAFDEFADQAITMGPDSLDRGAGRPVLALLWFCFPVTALPIAGKTLRALAYWGNQVSIG